MPIQLNEENGGKILVVHVSGKLAKADYEHFVPEFERLVRQHGKLRVLFDMTGFHGWKPGRFGRTSSSTLNTSRTSNGLRWSEIRNGSGNGDILQTVHKSDNPVLRSRRGH